MAKYIYEVELKSKAFLDKEQRSLITYFKYPAKRELIASNMKKLYPQFTKKEDEPIINIRRIKTKEYHERVNGKKIELHKDIVSAEI